MSREQKKCRIYYDNTGVKAYDKMMTERYKNRKDPDNILPEGITDAEFRNAVIDIFCGAGWYVVYPCSQAQVNEEALENIIETITKYVVDEPQWVIREDKASDHTFKVAIGNKFLCSEVLPPDATEEDVRIYRSRGYKILEVPMGYQIRPHLRKIRGGRR